MVKETAALILAGGHSRRMGADKALLSFRGETLLERAVRFWRDSGRVDRVYVAVGPADHIPKLPEGAVPVADLVDSRGPLGGLHAAFCRTEAQLLWVSGVDMPFLVPQAILPEPEGDALVYRDGRGRPEPLFGVYRRSVLPVIEEMLAEDCGKLRVLLERVSTQYVDVPPALEPIFRNVNTPEELLRARAGTPPILVVCGWSGSGKTTFLEQLIPALKGFGLRVGAVKHTHHPAAPESEHKDTRRLILAGAEGAVLLSGDKATPEEARHRLPAVDLILAEGFKHSEYPKLEIHRRATGKPFITRDYTLLCAVTDGQLDLSPPRLGLDDAASCAVLIRDFFRL